LELSTLDVVAAVAAVAAAAAAAVVEIDRQVPPKNASYSNSEERSCGKSMRVKD
jgi:hypothetical protein